VHFNGVSKRLMKTTEMQAWLEAFSTPANESWRMNKVIEAGPDATPRQDAAF